MTIMTDQSNLTLVMEIEKFPELYNYKLASYSRKDTTERAWAKVADKTKMPVNECKERWRNVRNTLIRSLKAPKSGSRLKKPYYLKDHLLFVLPYVRKATNVPLATNTPPPPPTEETSDDDQDATTQEEPTAATWEEPTAVKEEESAATAQYEEPTVTPWNKGRRQNIAMYSHFKKQSCPRESNGNRSKLNHFFISLLHEFDDMSDQEIRNFKIQTLQLIDAIKQVRQSPAHSRGESSPSHSSWVSAYSPITDVKENGQSQSVFVSANWLT